MPRLVLLAVTLAIALSVPTWGEVGALFSPEGVTDRLRGWGAWAWVAGFGLIVSDIVFPIPATAVMAALGVIYGPITGGLISAAATMTAGTIAYAVLRSFGPRAGRWLAGEKGMQTAERLFHDYGGWIVAGSRWMPILPETIAGLAGLARMPFPRFVTALACGALPMGLTAATIGHVGADAPLIAMAVSGLIPLMLWPLAHRLIHRAP